MTVSGLIKEIDKLPPEDVERVIAHINEPRFLDALREHAGDRIAAQRDAELDAGTVEAEPLDETFFPNLRYELRCE